MFDETGGRDPRILGTPNPSRANGRPDQLSEVPILTPVLALSEESGLRRPGLSRSVSG
jgi:hypothetical protein